MLSAAVGPDPSLQPHHQPDRQRQDGDDVDEVEENDHRASAAALEELNRALVLFGRRQALEGAEVLPPAGLAILLSGVEAILARFEFANHLSILVVDDTAPGMLTLAGNWRGMSEMRRRCRRSAPNLTAVDRSPNPVRRTATVIALTVGCNSAVPA